MANEKIVNRENLKEFRKAYDKRLTDGTLIPSKALTAQQVENVSEESGVVQETPFINQGTSTSNNTEETPTAPVAKQLEKQGNSVVVNQQMPALASGNGYSQYNYTTSLSFNNGVVTMTSPQGDDYNCDIYNTQQKKETIGHKYLILFDLYTDFPFVYVSYYNSDANYVLYKTNDLLFNAWQTLSVIYTSTLESKMSIRARSRSQIRKWYQVDLTQHFGSNDAIPQDLLDHPEHWSWYSNTDNAYSTDSLNNSTGRYLVCTGRQQWDEQWESGRIDNTGSLVTDTHYFRSKNYIPVIPNQVYNFNILNSLGTSRNSFFVCFYDINKNFISRQTVLEGSSLVNINFTTLEKCRYIKFFYGDYNNTATVTYNNDITISVVYTTGDGYDEYYPYVQPKVYDTGVETLRSAGSVKDIKLPSGEITRKVGVLDLSTLSWSWWAGQNEFYVAAPDTMKQYSNVALSDKYSNFNSYENMPNYSIFKRDGTSYIYVKTDGTQATTPTGTLYYELAEETIEQGTAFPENIEVDDYGTMYWLDTSNELVSIPQGTKLFYPADYVLLMDDLNIYTNGDVSKLALKTDLTASESVRDTIDSQLKEALGGTLRQCLCVKESLDFNNTAWVDLGELSWYRQTSDGRNVFILTNSLNGFKSGSKKILCTKYSTSNGTTYTITNKSIGSENLIIIVKDTTYTDATTFKNAMKGVLLAYEKAS